MARLDPDPPTGACGHLANVVVRPGLVGAPPSGAGFAECLLEGGTWVHLRRCLDCGHVGCCDSSPNRHASAHFRGTAHPLVQSFEPGEDWVWCYVDELPLESPDPVASPSHP